MHQPARLLAAAPASLTSTVLAQPPVEHSTPEASAAVSASN